jgi:signal transduction histidine kinase
LRFAANRSPPRSLFGLARQPRAVRSTAAWGTFEHRARMRPLRVLMVEDSEDDAMLVLLELRRGGYAPDGERVDSPAALRAALGRGGWDLVISDHRLKQLNGTDALHLVRELSPELPFLFVSGSGGDGGDEVGAAEAQEQGAGGFVPKQDLGRLVRAVERELTDAQVRTERRAAYEALEQAVAARDAFLNIASHELKTPLTSLQLQLQSLTRSVQQGDAGSDRVSEKIRAVARSTERLGELVNRLLDVSRITRGGAMELVKEEFDLSDLAREVAGRFQEAAGQTGSELRFTGERPVRGTWDRLRIDSIITNLLSNAVKYGQGKPIEVSVRAEGERALLEVTDHGIGIAPDDQARIFGRFERAVPVRHYGGFGVGLWVARSVAEEHGGKVRVTSRPGLGSTFTLELPRGEAGGKG